MIDVTFLTNKDKEELEKKIGEGGGGVSSWNDLTDKPFYEESSIVEILPETTLTTTDPGEFIIAENPPVIEGGKTYVVGWNGTDYTCGSVDLAELSGGQVSGVMVGNMSLQGLADTGEPFCIISMDGVLVVQTVGVDPLPTEATISIKGESTVVHKLDGKFLPEGVPHFEKGGMVEILPETVLAPEGIDDSEMNLDDIQPIVAGYEYHIKWNGTEYVCVGQDMSAFIPGAVAFGDLSMFGFGGNGEPFVVVYDPTEGVCSLIGMTGALTGVVVSITAVTAIAHKIDTQLLPDGFATLFEIPVTALGDSELGVSESAFDELCLALVQPNVIARVALIMPETGARMYLSLVMIDSRSAVFSYSAQKTSITIELKADGTASVSYG